MPAEMQAAGTDEELRISFVLPKGCYATTVLGEACALEDVSRQATARARLDEQCA
jgi:tRNA(Glu) U13 pseudouridine synthase TruD